MAKFPSRESRWAARLERIQKIEDEYIEAADRLVRRGQAARRMSFTFQLNLEKEVQRRIAQHSVYQQMDSAFSRMIRDAVAMYLEFREGNIATFKERFPGLIQRIAREHETDEIKRLRTEIQQLQQQLDGLSVGDITRPIRAVTDDDVQLVAEEVSPKRALDNLMESMGL